MVYTRYDCIITPGIILHIRPANERRRYNVTSSLIGWAHTQNEPNHWCLYTERQLPRFYFAWFGPVTVYPTRQYCYNKRCCFVDSVVLLLYIASIWIHCFSCSVLFHRFRTWRMCMNYIHGKRLLLIYCGHLMADLIHLLRDYCTGIGAIIRMPNTSAAPLQKMGKYMHESHND